MFTGMDAFHYKENMLRTKVWEGMYCFLSMEASIPSWMIVWTIHSTRRKDKYVSIRCRKNLS